MTESIRQLMQVDKLKPAKMPALSNSPWTEGMTRMIVIIVLRSLDRLSY